MKDKGTSGGFIDIYINLNTLRSSQRKSKLQRTLSFQTQNMQIKYE